MANPHVPVVGHPVGGQGVDRSSRLESELLGFEAATPVAMILKVPPDHGEDPIGMASTRVTTPSRTRQRLAGSWTAQTGSSL